MNLKMFLLILEREKERRERRGRESESERENRQGSICWFTFGNVLSKHWWVTVKQEPGT